MIKYLHFLLGFGNDRCGRRQKRIWTY